jgi:hypothetical protein
MLPFQSLDAATETGPGATLDLGTVAQIATIQVHGPGVTGECLLEGSLDDVNFISLASVDITVNGDQLATANTHLVRYIRANLTSVSGGSVTATVAAHVNEDTE